MAWCITNSSSTNASTYYQQTVPRIDLYQTPTSNILYWPTWHDQTTSSTMIVSTTSSTTNYWPVWHDSIAAPAIIHSEAYHREQEARMRQAREAEEVRRQDANAKAKELLVGHLTREQREMMDKLGWFVVRGSKSGRLYRIEARSIAGNVAELNDNKEIARYCCHLDHQYPAHDHHLAQKLMIEHDEETFLRLANKRAA